VVNPEVKSPTVKFPIDVSAVAFDLDGTLADTHPDIYESTNRTLADLGLAPVDAETVRSYIGLGIDRLVKRLLTGVTGSDGGAQSAGDRSANSHGAANGEPDPALLAEAGAIFRAHYRQLLTNESRLFPEMEDTLRRIRALGLKLACVTNKVEMFTRPLLDGLGVLHFFDEVVAGDTLERKKPDPLPLTWCAQRFGIAPARLLMVGDSETDTLCARAAGCPVICVPFGYRSGMALHELDCDAIVQAASELFELIRPVRP
jgi:phosphoglycolate phosphatase